MSSIEPFYFGRKSELFGIFHKALGAPKTQGVVIAGPLLNEGVRANIALRQISIKLAAAGFDVLRFDYEGTGNSSGIVETVPLIRWVENIATASQELVDISGSDRISIVAVRFAANLAATLAEERAINRFVMWDPILVGDHWVEHLMEHRDNVCDAFSESLLVQDREFMGHVTSPGFIDDVRARALNEMKAEKLVSVITDNYRHLDTLRQISGEVEQVSFECRWQDRKSGLLVPHRVIEAVCTAIR